MPVIGNTAEFGTGDICIGIGKNAFGEHNSIILEHSDKCHPIGKLADRTVDVPMSDIGEHIILIFGRVESLQVLIECLEELKERMLEQEESQ